MRSGVHLEAGCCAHLQGTDLTRTRRLGSVGSDVMFVPA